MTQVLHIRGVDLNLDPVSSCCSQDSLQGHGDKRVIVKQVNGQTTLMAEEKPTWFQKVCCCFCCEPEPEIATVPHIFKLYLGQIYDTVTIHFAQKIAEINLDHVVRPLTVKEMNGFLIYAHQWVKTFAVIRLLWRQMKYYRLQEGIEGGVSDASPQVPIFVKQATGVKEVFDPRKINATLVSLGINLSDKNRINLIEGVKRRIAATHLMSPILVEVFDVARFVAIELKKCRHLIHYPLLYQYFPANHEIYQQIKEEHLLKLFWDLNQKKKQLSPVLVYSSSLKT